MREDINKASIHYNCTYCLFLTELTHWLVHVVALSRYEHDIEDFKNEVNESKKKFSNSIEPDGLASDRQDVVDGYAFSLSSHRM
ncbi:protein ROOT HAIR DEFECTIVE 3-like [Rutidosis leptorrhynchoides]|uniref:protein ROOT HAIR DEFECTIVE 3-like n=1 Tax=Rutidosis leptorrhynchoides TaxID=125765 RepID=UPI003A9A1B78